MLSDNTEYGDPQGFDDAEFYPVDNDEKDDYSKYRRGDDFEDEYYGPSKGRRSSKNDKRRMDIWDIKEKKKDYKKDHYNKYSNQTVINNDGDDDADEDTSEYQESLIYNKSEDNEYDDDEYDAEALTEAEDLRIADEKRRIAEAERYEKLSKEIEQDAEVKQRKKKSKKAKAKLYKDYDKKIAEENANSDMSNDSNIDGDFGF